MIKHIARHNQKKCVVLFNKVPHDDLMCLIVYSDALPRLYHEAVMECVESSSGQQAMNFGEALGTKMMKDGRIALNVLHSEGFIRKVPTNQCILTPTTQTTIRLDELNTMLKDMDSGAEAKEKMAKMDADIGMQTKQLINEGPITASQASVGMQASDTGSLSDADIAQGQLSQATRMEVEAKGMIAESKRMKAEAYKMAPELKPKRGRKPGVKKVTSKSNAKLATVKS